MSTLQIREKKIRHPREFYVPKRSHSSSRFRSSQSKDATLAFFGVREMEPPPDAQPTATPFRRAALALMPDRAARHALLAAFAEQDDRDRDRELLQRLGMRTDRPDHEAAPKVLKGGPCRIEAMARHRDGDRSARGLTPGALNRLYAQSPSLVQGGSSARRPPTKKGTRAADAHQSYVAASMVCPQSDPALGASFLSLGSSQSLSSEEVDRRCHRRARTPNDTHRSGGRPSAVLCGAQAQSRDESSLLQRIQWKLEREQASTTEERTANKSTLRQTPPYAQGGVADKLVAARLLRRDVLPRCAALYGRTVVSAHAGALERGQASLQHATAKGSDDGDRRSGSEISDDTVEHQQQPPAAYAITMPFCQAPNRVTLGEAKSAFLRNVDAFVVGQWSGGAGRRSGAPDSVLATTSVKPERRLSRARTPPVGKRRPDEQFEIAGTFDPFQMI